MVNRLPSWVFIALALVLMGLALLPLLRAALGIDEQIQMQFFTVVMLLIAGLMCGLTGMLLLARRQPEIRVFQTEELDPQRENRTAALIHVSGLLVFTGIPLANFMACYFLWLRNRQYSPKLDIHGREAICQQITFYLYAMMCLFMALLIIGIFGLMFLLALHLVITLIAISQALDGKVFRYPANIAVVDRKIYTDSSNNESETMT